MKHTEKELQILKDDVAQMWKLVLSQLEKAKQALLTNDLELAREIAAREKRVDAFELKIDSDCENFIALYSPVAVDLRLVLSFMRISSTLERVGDFAEGIARFVIKSEGNVPDNAVLEDLQMEAMFDAVISMLSDSFVALEAENTSVAGKILLRDDDVDAIFLNSVDVLAKFMQQQPEFMRWGLRTMLILRKLERIGDHCSNIVEEIVFYVDAKVLKHQKIESKNNGD